MNVADSGRLVLMMSKKVAMRPMLLTSAAWELIVRACLTKTRVLEVDLGSQPTSCSLERVGPAVVLAMVRV